MATVADNVLFMIILDLKWLVYIVQLIILNVSLIPFILAVNLILYTESNVIKYGLIKAVLAVTGTKEPSRGVGLATPLMSWYFGFYLRTTRSLGYIMEALFRISYWDPWNPWKVVKEALKEGV
jgi:hypothetical protein